MKELIAPLIRRLNQMEEQVKRLSTHQGDFSRRSLEVNVNADSFTADHHDHFMLQPEVGVSDNLVTINGGSDGRRIVLYPKDVGDTITVLTSGNIATTRILDSPTDALELIYSAQQGKWIEPSSGSSGGDVAAHAGVHYVTAHPSPPSSNPIREYYSVNYGIVGGAGSDESNNILEMFDTIGAGGGGIVHINSVDPTDPIQLDKLVSLYWSNMDVRFNSSILLGALGGLRMMGELDEFVRAPATNAGKLDVTASEGDKILVLAVSGTSMQADDFVVGDQIVIRGENDVTGKALYKQILNVVAIDVPGNEIEIAQELEYDFEPTYPLSEWPPDLTTGTTIYVVRICGLTVDEFRGDMTAVVTNIENAEIGALYRISDGRNENQLNPAAIRGSLLPYENDANMEFLRIVAVDVGTDTITFDRPLSNDYLSSTPYFGALARVLPVENSRISGARMSYSADQASKNAHALATGFCLDCEFSDCTILGQITSTTGRRGQACRIADSLNCWGKRLIIRDAGHVDSGEGYGLTHYKSTGGGYEACEVWGCRHNFLVQASVMFTLRNCQSHDDHISGFDLHGANERDGILENCTATRSVGHTPDASNGALFRYGNTSHAVGCHYVSTINCKAIAAYETNIAGFDFLPASTNLSFISCYAEGCYYGFKATKNSLQCQPVQEAAYITFQSCYLSNITERAVYIQANPTYDGIASVGEFNHLTFKGLVLNGTLEHFHIEGNGGVSDLTFSECEIVNPIPGNDFYAFDITDVVDLIIDHCSLIKTSRGISIEDCTNIQLTGNTMTSLVDGYALVETGTNTNLLWLPPQRITFVRAALADAATSTTLFPISGTVPTTSDGDQIISVSYTPLYPGAPLRIRAVVPFLATSAADNVSMAVFVGSVCVGVTACRVTSGATSGLGFILECPQFNSALAIGAVTITLRLGAKTAGTTVTLNDHWNASSGLLCQPFLVIEE